MFALSGTEEFNFEGSEYFVGLFDNFEPPPSFKVGLFHLAILSTSDYQNAFTVTSASGSVTYQESTEVLLNSDANEVNNPSIRNRAIHVVSATNHPLSVIAYDEEFTSADAYKALACVHLPVDSYYEYYGVSTPIAEIPVVIDPDYDYEYDNLFNLIQGNSVLLIITCEDNTELNITLTQSVEITAPDLLQQVSSGVFNRDMPVTIKLSNAGETLSISSENDLTGSRVTSNKPINFITGHECGAVPNDINYCDKLVEQVPPTVTWGNTFITAPIAGRNAFDVFKFIAAQDAIEIVFSCNSEDTHFNLNKGEFRSVSINSSVYCFVNSTGPVLLVQLSVGSNFESGYVNGDPFMVIIPPIEQYRSSYNISVIANTGSSLENYYINFLLPYGVDSSGIRLDGLVLNEDISFTTIMCSGQTPCGSAAQMEVTSGQYALSHTNLSATFNAIVYWAGFRLGSGYFAGMNQKPITRTHYMFFIFQII